MRVFNFFLKTFLLGALALVLFWVGLSFSDQISFTDRSWPFEKDKRYRTKSDIPLLQKFRAAQDGLYQIEINFSETDTNFGDGGELNFKILDQNCAMIIREQTIFLNSLESNEQKFIFEKISDSKGQAYCLSVQYSPRPDAENIQIIFSKKLHPDNISLFAGDQEIKDRSLSMRPAYRSVNIQAGVSELNQRMSQYKPWFLKHYSLYTVVFGFIILSIVAAVLLILL